jgi:aspartyl-tRNA(Asn)/glutamyl-tRNA(Gln) amidotransferase subunit A
MPTEPETIATLARRLRAREVTAEAITDNCLGRIAEKNAALNAFITVFEDEARAQARAADREIAEGRYRGALHGVPISLKDLIDVEGVATTAGSRVRAGHVAAVDAPLVAKLREAGAILIGKCNLHEFAFGTTNEDSAFGPAHHPLDATRSPGGSSGGSAISVATGMAYASIGTDTGGSIRIPASACGLVGLKPAHGDISFEGVVPLSSTLDHVGPLCRSVEDARILFEALRTKHLAPAPGTSTPHPAHAHAPSTPHPAHAPSTQHPAPSTIRLGIPRDYFLSLLDPQVARAFDDTCARLRDAGVTLEDVDILHATEIAPVYLQIVLCEAAAYHAKTLESHAEAYTEPVRLRLEMGRYLLAEDYVRALGGRDVLRRELDRALEGRDGLLLPSLAILPPKLGAATVRVGTADEPVRNIMLRLTQLFNVTGHPAITVPCGASAEGLPIGVQIAGGSGTSALLELAQTLEPPLTGGFSGGGSR